MSNFNTKVYAQLKLGPRTDETGERHIATAELHSLGNQDPYFSITVDSWPAKGPLTSNRMNACGCQHDIIKSLFPEWAKYLKWHLTSTSGPMHYISNTLYHAGNRDYNGLLEGEKRHLKNGRTKLPVWHLVVRDKEGVELVNPMSGQHCMDSDTCPEQLFTIAYEPVWTIGGGKQLEFDAARSSAVWPEATDEQLSLPKEKLEKLLLDRLPALMAEFDRDLTELFGENTWRNETTKEATDVI